MTRCVPVSEPVRLVRKLAECGAWGVNLHDNDLVPHGASASERDRIVGEFKAAVEDSGMVVPMATTNLFSMPLFRDGAFTSNDPKVRAFALRKTMDAIDLGVELGARIFVFWGGREGSEADACRDPRTALARMRDAIDFLCDYVKENDYDLVFALEAKPNEPRSDIYFPTTGHMLHFISTLASSRRWSGSTPRWPTRHGRPVLRARRGPGDGVGKLFHIDLNAQKIGRYDQDLRFGSEDLKQAFLLVRLLEGTAQPATPRYERAAALRRPRLPQRGRGGRVGLRAWVHAHIQDPGRAGARLRRRSRGERSAGG